MRPEVLPWQQENWQILSNYMQQQRPPQSLLISGLQGLGKLILARQFAQTLVCPNSIHTGFYCVRCHSCRLFVAKTHPDVITIQPESETKSIQIQQIRTLITRLSLKPQFESYRVVLIYPADAMNLAASNSLLKCLEEPNERTCFILIAAQPSLLPATIISRCQKITLYKPSIKIAINWLKHKISHPNPQLLLNLAQGAPLLAQQYAQTDILLDRTKHFNLWLSVTKFSTAVLEIASVWAALQNVPILTWIITWVADIIKCSFNCASNYLENSDFKLELQALAIKLNPQKLYKFYDLLLQSQQQMHTQINKQLLFENILLQWSTLNTGK